METAPVPAPAPAVGSFEAPEAATVRQGASIASRGWPAAALGCSGCLLWLGGLALLGAGMIDAFSRGVALRACADGERIVVVREISKVPVFGGGGNSVEALRIDAQGNGQSLPVGYLASMFSAAPCATVPVRGRVFGFYDDGARPLEGGPLIESDGEILACGADGDRALALVSRDRRLRLAQFDGERWSDAGALVLPGSGLVEAGAGGPGEEEGTEHEEGPEGEDSGGPVVVSAAAFGTSAHHWSLLVHRGEPWLFWKDTGGLSYSMRANGEWSTALKFGSVEEYAAASDGERVIVVYDRMTARRIFGLSGLGFHVWENGAWRFGEILRESENVGVNIGATAWGGCVAVAYGGGSRVSVAEIAAGRVRRVREVVPFSSGRVRWSAMLTGLAGMAVLAIPVLWGISRWSDRVRPRAVSGDFGSGRTGSLFARGCAHGVDALLSAGPVFGVYAWQAATAQALSDNAGGALPLDALGWALFAYGAWLIAFEAILGTTPGKALFGLRVLSRDGRPPGVHAALARNLFRVIDAVPGVYLVGGVATVLSDRAQRLGDLVSGTLVIEKRGWAPRSGSTNPRE